MSYYDMFIMRTPDFRSALRDVHHLVAMKEVEELILDRPFAQQIDQVHKLTTETKLEFGGMVMRDKNGLKVGMLRKGENREIIIEPTRKLRNGEEILGSFHTHPISSEPSHWDIGSFLQSKWEKVSLIFGANGMINLTIKTDITEPVLEKVDLWKQKYEQVPIADIAKKHKFLYYRGFGRRLTLLNPSENSRQEDMDLEDLIRGIKGTKDTSEEQIKKKPKEQVFSTPDFAKDLKAPDMKNLPDYLHPLFPKQETLIDPDHTNLPPVTYSPGAIKWVRLKDGRRIVLNDDIYPRPADWELDLRKAFKRYNFYK